MSKNKSRSQNFLARFSCRMLEHSIGYPLKQLIIRDQTKCLYVVITSHLMSSVGGRFLVITSSQAR